MVSWASLQCVTVVFPGHTHLLFFLSKFKKSSRFLEVEGRLPGVCGGGGYSTCFHAT